MPRSKSNRRGSRSARAAKRARRASAPQGASEGRKLTPAQYTRGRAIGWTLIAVGVVVFAQHLLSHLGFFTLVSPGVDDIVAGYPLAGVLGISGVILLSR